MRKPIVESLGRHLAALLLCSGLGAALAAGETAQRGISASDAAIVQQAQRLRAQKKPKEAAALLEPLVARQPNYFNAQYELGLAISDVSEDIPKAIPVLVKAAEIKRANPQEIKDAHVFNSLGWAYMYDGQRVKAEAAFKEALDNQAELTPDVKRKVYNNLGYLYLSSGRNDEARQYLTIAAKDYESTQAKWNLQTLDAVEKRQKAAGPK